MTKVCLHYCSGLNSQKAFHVLPWLWALGFLHIVIILEQFDCVVLSLNYTVHHRVLLLCYFFHKNAFVSMTDTLFPWQCSSFHDICVSITVLSVSMAVFSVSMALLCYHGSTLCFHGSVQCFHGTALCYHGAALCFHGSVQCFHGNALCF